MTDVTTIQRVALLIDAENISSAYAQLILNEAGRIGNVVSKRIYGDWSSPSLTSWKKPILDFSIHAIQQFHNISGKNASDSALIIDAMDLLYERKYDCICIISSDSDFTRLAARLRESEIYVVGMGEKKTPVSFRSACDRFLYLDVLMKAKKEITKEETGSGYTDAGETGTTIAPSPDETEEIESGLDQAAVINAINDILDNASDEDGWVFLGILGSTLLMKYSDFDVRNFGYKKLSNLLESFNLYEFKKVPSTNNPSSQVIYCRKAHTAIDIATDEES